MTSRPGRLTAPEVEQELRDWHAISDASTDPTDKLTYMFAALRVLGSDDDEQPSSRELWLSYTRQKFYELGYDVAADHIKKQPPLPITAGKLFETKEDFKRCAPWLFEKKATKKATVDAKDKQVQTDPPPVVRAAPLSLRSLMGLPPEEVDEPPPHEPSRAAGPPGRAGRRDDEPFYEEPPVPQPARPKFRIPTSTTGAKAPARRQQQQPQGGPPPRQQQPPPRGGGHHNQQPPQQQPRQRRPARGAAEPPPANARSQDNKSANDHHSEEKKEEEELPERLKGCDPEMVRRIENEITQRGAAITFDDVAGLDKAKRSLTEMVIWPMRRPELFVGLRSVPKGLLLFGPPGTGKTLIGRAIASSCNATFFAISASSLTSKWIGESEKLVRTLFAVAGLKEPSVVFVDEVDSMLTQRSSGENEASRRLKTEFLVQLEGVDSSHADERVLVVGATNRPQELDEAARRRFVKRFYVPLPDAKARSVLFRTLLKTNGHNLSDADVAALVAATDGFSGADCRNLSQEAAMGPMREVGAALFASSTGAAPTIPPITAAHFRDALRVTRATVAQSEITFYEDWNRQFGTGGNDDDDEPPPAKTTTTTAPGPPAETNDNKGHPHPKRQRAS